MFKSMDILWRDIKKGILYVTRNYSAVENEATILDSQVANDKEIGKSFIGKIGL
jgi:hypothetical protein